MTQATPVQESRFHPPASLPACALTSLNAFKHGGAADTLFLPNEDPDVFFAGLLDAFQYYKPANAEQSDIVTDSVHARWMLARRQRILARYEFDLHAENPNPLHWHKEALQQLDLFDRYKTTAERSLRRALINVHSMHKDTVRLQHWQQLFDLKKQSFALQVEKWEHTKKLRDDKEARQAARAGSSTQPSETSPIQNLGENDEPVIYQRAFISINENGGTHIDALLPSNQKVREIILNLASYKNPPVEVLRNFYFLDGIPADYEFIITPESPRPADPCCERGWFMSFDQWQNLAVDEDEMIAKQPPNEDDEEDAT